MNRVSRYAFINGKMHGIMAKSFLDERLQTLLHLTSLLDLSRILFPGSDAAPGDRELIHSVQRKFEETILSSLLRLLSVFPKPPELLVQVIREYDYRNLKALIRNRLAPANPLRLWNIGTYGRAPSETEGFPKSLEKTPYADLIDKIGKESLFEIEFSLDKRYYAELLQAVKNLSKSEKKLIEPLIREEIVLQNILWALRLRFYFNRSEEETKEHLFPFDFTEIIRYVEKMYELPSDYSEQWKEWKYSDLVIFNSEGRIDLGETELRAMKRIYKKIRHAFFHYPFHLASVYAFFRLKHYEARMIQSVTEGVRMGLAFPDLSRILGIA
jgi:vacuolar-type H+-ATPase subunit C/Vma6